MRPGMYFSLFLGGTALLGLASCETIKDIAPTITEIQAPGDATTSGAYASLSSAARVDPKGFAYADVYFTLAPDPELLFDSDEALVTTADCTPATGSESALDCRVQAVAAPGTWYYQWHIDYGASGADIATLSRPLPAEESFEVTFVAAQPPAGEDPPDDMPAEEEILSIYDPEDGERCVGTFIGFDFGEGSTVVPVRWKNQSSGEGMSLAGDYQFMVEHPAAPNCGSQDPAALDFENPSFAFGYTEQNGCYVVATNNNDTATPALEANRDFRARVRRILPGDTFGTWSNYSNFVTASSPTEAPELVTPEAGGVVDIPDSYGAQDVEIEWRVANCPPNFFNVRIFQDDEPTPFFSAEGACQDEGGHSSCKVTPLLARGHQFLVAIEQSNIYGSIEDSFSFSTE